ncbi:MAG: viperin family antiviral radical SAM protein [Bacteroidia bacterium]
MKTEECLPTSKDDPDSIKQLITAVNFHLWQPCNFRCKFCFATFADVKREVLPKGHLPKEKALEVIAKLAMTGFEKITFAGGEPTLCPWLAELVIAAKEFGLTTGIITNGSKLTPNYLASFEGKLDWIGISIDSLEPETNRKSGRSEGCKSAPDIQYYLSLCKLVTEPGCKLKINTVVHALNKHEGIIEFIQQVKPSRWKVMRILPVSGQNDEHYKDMAITDEEFASYIVNNTLLTSEIDPVVEDHQNIIGSYLMVDPAGRFFDDTTGTHTYSKPILEVGAKEALKGISFFYDKFIERKGLYDWR